MAKPLSTIFRSTKPYILKPPKSTNFESSKPTYLKNPSSSNPIASFSNSSKLKKSRKSNANSHLPSSSNPSESSGNDSELLMTPATSSTKFNNSRKSRSLWCVYLILSTNPPIKTYVGVTINFFRRLKQHNGEIKGGAKASRSGRPWICACLIGGFTGRSEACAFESKWKQVSRKLPRKRKTTEEQKPEDNGSFALLQHRLAALDRVQSLMTDCSHLNIDWRSNFF